MEFDLLKGFSTTDVLISMLWLACSSAGIQTQIVMFLNFSKAFDRINNKILIEKIYLPNVDNPLIN